MVSVGIHPYSQTMLAHSGGVRKACNAGRRSQPLLARRNEPPKHTSPRPANPPLALNPVRCDQLRSSNHSFSLNRTSLMIFHLNRSRLLSVARPHDSSQWTEHSALVVLCPLHRPSSPRTSAHPTVHLRRPAPAALDPDPVAAAGSHCFSLVVLPVVETSVSTARPSGRYRGLSSATHMQHV